jgi:hypothetical protein
VRVIARAPVLPPGAAERNSFFEMRQIASRCAAKKPIQQRN